MTIRSLVSRILDMSAIHWEGQSEEAVQLLRNELNREFVFKCRPLGELLKKKVLSFLKTEHSSMRGKYEDGDARCPLNVDPQQWERLKVYFDSAAQKEKSRKMAEARRCVKTLSNVGRKGKASKGLREEEKDDVANGTPNGTESNGQIQSAMSNQAPTRIVAIENKQTALDSKQTKLEEDVAKFLQN